MHVRPIKAEYSIAPCQRDPGTSDRPFFLLFLFLFLFLVILSVVLFCRPEPPTTYRMYGTTQDAFFRSQILSNDILHRRERNVSRTVDKLVANDFLQA